MNCRFCLQKLERPVISLGHSPISNAYLTSDQLLRMEPFYPLEVFVCDQCYLVQLPEFETPQSIFSDYAYFSSFSDSWLKHAETYAKSTVQRFKLGSSSQVIELASNDGYLLQYFKTLGIPVLGVEPAANVARVALSKGIPTEVAFFGREFASRLASESRMADLMVANNVLAHVPDLHDFVGGIAQLLKPEGVLTVEFPHLLHLIEQRQFDTIYHEHFSYLSLATASAVMKHHGLKVFDVEELPTHGGSLRIYVCRHGAQTHSVTTNVERILKVESEHGLRKMETYRAFNAQVQTLKREILSFLIQAKNQGKRIVGYGAPAKGNTLLNYCGIREDLIDFTVDRNPRKQGRFLPGSHIPIFSPDQIRTVRPDYVFILPWNLREEIVAQLSYVREWGGKFVVPVPQVEVFG